MSFLDWDVTKIIGFSENLIVGVDPVNAIEETGSIFSNHVAGTTTMIAVPKLTSGYPQAQTAGRLRSLVRVLSSTGGNPITNVSGSRCGIMCQLANRTLLLTGGYSLGLVFTNNFTEVFLELAKLENSGGLTAYTPLVTRTPTADVFGETVSLGQTVALELSWFADTVQIDGVVLQARVGSAADYSDLQDLYINALDVSATAYQTTVGEGVFSDGVDSYTLIDETHFNPLIF